MRSSARPPCCSLPKKGFETTDYPISRPVHLYSWPAVHFMKDIEKDGTIKCCSICLSTDIQTVHIYCVSFR